jgi:hypothetical protein
MQCAPSKALVKLLSHFHLRGDCSDEFRGCIGLNYDEVRSFVCLHWAQNCGSVTYAPGMYLEAQTGTCELVVQNQQWITFVLILLCTSRLVTDLWNDVIRDLTVATIVWPLVPLCRRVLLHYCRSDILSAENCAVVFQVWVLHHRYCLYIHSLRIVNVSEFVLIE